MVAGEANTVKGGDMLGVCYYPEHWPEELWLSDAADMKALGLEYVRIGEFAWSRIEPKRNAFDFDWLDRSIEILAAAGLKIVFGTPTATPPKWLVDEFPEILPVDPASGHVRGFGSRRHYDFSSGIYQDEAARITEILATRYGAHEAIVGWQTDNELSCHDTTLSASEAAKSGFRQWCRSRYGSVAALNEAWGNVFWSMEYGAFDEIDLPVGAVTETNPAHQLAYRRYSSDKVVEFHDRMVAIIRRHAPGKWITHNYIPKEDLSVDPYALGASLDFPSYDNYPLGRSDLAFADAPADEIRRYMRTGHPDFASFYHDTTRSFSGAGYWVMEQQPGPVNWAPHNPRPAPGMVRLWTLEAFAHGAACVSYFRWRQVPFAQEQMHAGLRRADNSNAAAWPEVEQVYRELGKLDIATSKKNTAAVAIVTDIEALWVSDIERQGAGYEYARLEFAYYSALRQLGVDVDFISKDSGFENYRLVAVPCLPIVDQEFVDRCSRSDARFVFGPRTGSKTPDFQISDGLPPGNLQALLPVKVTSVETLRPDCPEQLRWKTSSYQATIWCEELVLGENVEALAHYETGEPAIAAKDRYCYVGTVTDDVFLRDFFRDACEQAEIETSDLPDNMRLCRRGDLHFVFNYSEVPQIVPAPSDADFIIGDHSLAPRDVAVWRLPDNGKSTQKTGDF